MSDMTLDPDDVARPARTSDARERRLLDGVADLRRRARLVIDGERVLFVIGAVLAPLGFLFIMIAWYGASDTGDVFEQVPYLISGGLGGLGLMVLGGFLYNAWWLTRQVRESREQHAELLARHEELARTNQQLAESLVALQRTVTDSADRSPRRRQLRAE